MINVRIKEERTKKGMSQLELAQRVGSKQPNVVRWERGEISIQKLQAVARALGCTVEKLLAD